jgi:hypothetical protein
MEENENKKNPAPKTTQDEGAPQDENPMTTPLKSSRNSEKTLNDPTTRKIKNKDK